MRGLVVLIALIVLPSGAIAQTPESDEPGIQTIILDRANIERVASASVDYTMPGLHLDGPMLYQFAISEFADSGTAERAFAILTEEYIDELVAHLPDDLQGAVTPAEASPPSVGDAHYAALITIEQDIFPVQVGVVYVRLDHYIIGAAATGVIGNMVLATEPYLRTMIERIDEGISVVDALPGLADMPPGFIVAND